MPQLPCHLVSLGHLAQPQPGADEVAVGDLHRDTGELGGRSEQPPALPLHMGVLQRDGHAGLTSSATHSTWWVIGKTPTRLSVSEILCLELRP